MSPYVEKFVLHIGEMGSRWGLNRTLGQMCGLLFISPDALNADQIAETLGISRSNVSMALKELKAWRLVHPVSIPGDRREYWTTSKDVWELLRTLSEERRRREIDPTLTMLRETLLTEAHSETDRYAEKRLREMHDLIEMLDNWVDDMNSLPPTTLMRLLKLGRKIQGLLKPRGNEQNSSATDSK